ncbi:MAG: 2-oxo acid dehydrogenase subunit E2 [Myxococcales bacterium]|nr:2-oxo acid dehydrogenase subunit E2 [Myxococcales bacterium]
MAKMSTRRKLAIATWRAPQEGNIYGKLTLDATAVLDYIKDVRLRTGEKVTITHVVGRAVAMALQKAPDLNGRIVFGRFEPFPSVNVTYLVSLKEGADLAKATIEDADKKGVTEIASELRALAGKLHKGEDADFEKSKGLLRALPTWLIRPLLFITGWLASAVGMSIPALGVRPFPFGSCVVTSVGMLGLDEGFAPPTPFARVPLWVLVGALRDQPAVVDGELAIRPLISLTATIDHRFIDGFQGGILAKEIRRVFASPELLDEVTKG